jgi:aquaporin Z
MEADELALYMFFACAFATRLRHPASPIPHVIVSDLIRRALYGLAIGATVVAIVMTPWGKQSGGQSGGDLCLLSARKGGVLGCFVLYYRTTLGPH